LLRSSLPGIGISAAVVAVSLAIYGATQDDARGPAPSAVGATNADVTLPPPLAASGPFGPQPVAGVRGGGDDGPAPVGGVVFVPVVFDPPATLPAAPRPFGGGQRREGGNRGQGGDRDRRPEKRGRQGRGRTGGVEHGETVRPPARPATPAPQQPQRPSPQRPDPPQRPVAPPVKAGNPRAPGLLKKPGQLPPGQAKNQAAPAPAPVASAPAPVAPAPKPSRPAKPPKPVVPPGQAKKQAPAPAAPPAAAPAPAAPPASGCAPAGNGHGKANGRC